MCPFGPILGVAMLVGDVRLGGEARPGGDAIFGVGHWGIGWECDK